MFSIKKLLLYILISVALITFGALINAIDLENDSQNEFINNRSELKQKKLLYSRD